MLPESIKQLAARLSNLPGIGPRQAIRIAIYISQKESSFIDDLAGSLQEISNLKNCSDCFLPHANQSSRCRICSDPKRTTDLIAIVEKITDLLSIEQSQAYSGKYLVLGDLKKDGELTPEQEKRIGQLITQLTSLPNSQAEEIIIALSPTNHTQISADKLEQRLRGKAKKITRLGRGLPTGADIEFSDDETLKNSLKNRS